MNSVMVLDKDGESGLTLQKILEEEGFSVTTAQFGEELDMSNGLSEIDLYVVDIAFPGGIDLDLIRQLREQSTGGIIILGAQDSEALCVAGLENGADDYIGKPFRPRELAARAKAVCRRTAGNRKKPTVARKSIVVGGYRLVSESRSVLDPDNREITLTTAEYNIFSVLAYHQGKVLTRDEIIGLSKGRDWRCYERSVDGLISRLRRKLPAPPGASHFIKTVHGTGYTIPSV